MQLVLSKNFIVIIPPETFRSVKILENRNLGNHQKTNEKNERFSQELQDELEDVDAFSEIDEQ